jgi:hypothetical protein
MAITLQQQASVGNGLLVLASAALAVYEPTRPVGILLGLAMGAGLIFSGYSGFCGWIRICSALPWNSSNSASDPTALAKARLDEHYQTELQRLADLMQYVADEQQQEQLRQQAANLQNEYRSKLAELPGSIR